MSYSGKSRHPDLRCQNILKMIAAPGILVPFGRGYECMISQYTNAEFFVPIGQKVLIYFQ